MVNVRNTDWEVKNKTRNHNLISINKERVKSGTAAIDSIQFCERMVISPNLEMSFEKMKDLISELQEMILRQQHRIASLEDRLGRQNEIVLERLGQQE
jgi:hypothetical protein